MAESGQHSGTVTARQLGGPGEILDDGAVQEFVTEQLEAADLDGRSVCIVVPDATRRCPLPLLLSSVHTALAGRARRLTVLVALGTHSAMDDRALAAHVGCRPGALTDRYPAMTFHNHAWWDPSALTWVGTVSSERMSKLSEGRLEVEVPVRVNRAVLEHDVTIVVGPVFPHEVVGFSGGNKYLFPGVSGRELIDVSHWLGALITSARIIGTRGTTPVRTLIDEAAAFLPVERLALCVVTAREGAMLHSVAFGTPVAAWEAAAVVSAATHVVRLDLPVERVLSLVAERYGDLWTGAKGFYKVEPVVADGGEVVLYAPHITEIGPTHPQIREIGYHCRDYFVQQWDRFSHYHWGDLAHCTHLRGQGSYDPAYGEHFRVDVTLATGIPERVVRSVNLGYLDPATVDVDRWRSDPSALVVPDAGEDLYRLAED